MISPAHLRNRGALSREVECIHDVGILCYLRKIQQNTISATSKKILCKQSKKYYKSAKKREGDREREREKREGKKRSHRSRRERVDETCQMDTETFVR